MESSLINRMQAIYITSAGETSKIHIISPADVFGIDKFTIIGACIDYGYVYIGYTPNIANALPVNTNIPQKLIDISVFESSDIRGPLLVVQTDLNGDVIDIDFKF
jgi:hypothetical protein